MRKKEEKMDTKIISYVLWIAACALLILYLLRRRKRKGSEKAEK